MSETSESKLKITLEKLRQVERELGDETEEAVRELAGASPVGPARTTEAVVPSAPARRLHKNITIHTMHQDSDAWDEIRRGKATSSRFSEIVTPAQLKLSSSATRYAAELVAERLGIASPKPEPTYWMERGLEAEQHALGEFQDVTKTQVQQVGFIETQGYDVGCSPDAIVDGHALVEIKCPKVETLIKWHAAGELPRDYVMQVQGQLWVTGASCCYFFAWHPELQPLLIEVPPDEKVHAALGEHMIAFLQTVNEMQSRVTARKPRPEWIINPGVAVFDG